VTSQVSRSLSFPSQRQKYFSLVKYGINLSGVGEIDIPYGCFSHMYLYFDPHENTHNEILVLDSIRNH